MYSEEEEVSHTVEIMDNALDLGLNLGNGPANLYLEL